MKNLKRSLVTNIILRSILLFSMQASAAEIKVLFIGQDTASEIPAYLTSLVSGDSSLTDTINAEFYSETDVLGAYYETRSVPSDSNTLLNKLDEGFDYVFIQPEEGPLFKYPGLSLEEVRLVQQRLQGSGAHVVLSMIWGRNYADEDAPEFEEYTYRIGDALEVDVIPAGLAWVDARNDVGSIFESSPAVSLTAEASYLMAASAYAYIFEQPATNSTYTPAVVTTDEREALLGHSYSNWVSASTDLHYTGAYTNGFCSPNQIPFNVSNTRCVFLGSSTEQGYGVKWTDVMNDGGYDANRTHVSRYKYPGSPIFPDLIYSPAEGTAPAVSNILASTYYDFACARFDGYPTTSEYQDLHLYSQNSSIPFIGFRYQGDDIPDTLSGISSKTFWAANHAYDKNAELGHGMVFNLPAEIAFGRLWERSPDLVEFSGVHVSDYVDAAVASMLYTMLTGENCTSFAHPGSMGQEQEQYEYAQNLGYTIIQQLGSLQHVANDEANTRPAAVIGSDTSTHSSPDIYGGGVFYFVDSDTNGTESCSLHALNSYDYEGSVTGIIWSDQGVNESTAAHFTNTVNTGTSAVFGLAAIDDLSQTSLVTEATIRVLDPLTLLHDDMDVATSGGYGWADPEWTLNSTTYAFWSEANPYNGRFSLNIQRTGKASRKIDLSAVTNGVVFEYQWKGISLEEGETATMEVYDGTWHTLKTVDSSMADGVWHAESFVLSAFNLISTFEIRFTIAGSDNKDDFYIDAMRIYETDLPLSPVHVNDLLDDPSFTNTPDATMPLSGSETFEYSAADEHVRFDTSNTSSLAGQVSSFTAPINILDDAEVITDPNYELSTTRLTGISPTFVNKLDTGLAHIGALQLAGGTQQLDAWYVITLDTVDGIHTATSGVGNLFGSDSATLTQELVDTWNSPLSWNIDPFTTGGVVYEDINHIDIEWFHETIVANTLDDNAVFRMDRASISYDALLVSPDAIAPEAPLAVSILSGSHFVELNWPDSIESDVVYYHVFRSETSGNGYALVGKVATSYFLDSTVENDIPYYYQITAVDYSNNESPKSDEVSATPAVITQAFVTYTFDTGLNDSTSAGSLIAGDISYATGSNSDSGTAVIQDTAARAWDNRRASGDYILSIGQRGIGNSGIADANFDIGAASQLSFTLNPNAGESFDFSTSSMTFDSFFYSDAASTLSEGYKVWADTGAGFVALAPLQSISTPYVADTGIRLFETDETTTSALNPLNSATTVHAELNAMSFNISSLGALAADQSVTFAITISGNRNNQYAWNTAIDNLTLDLTLLTSGGYADWATPYNLVGGATDDDDGDGLSNIHEFGVGGNPTNSADIGYEPILDMVEDTGTNWMHYIHVRQTDPNSGITYLLEESPDLAPKSWTHANATQIGPAAVLPADPDFESVTNRIPTTETQKFIRLKITESL